MKSLEKYSGLILLMMLAVFFSIQISYLIISQGRIGGDDSLTGLTALHILKGERPIFLHGQVYGGTLKAFLTAILFKIFGPSPFILLFAATLFAAGFIISTYYLAKLIFSEKVALLAVLFLALAPNSFMGYSHSAIGTYIENIFFGNLILLFTWLIIKDEKTGLFWYGLLGFTTGLAWWTNYAIIYYLLTAAIFIVYQVMTSSGFSGISRKARPMIILGIFFILGSWPYWLFNWRTNWLTFTQTKTSLINLKTLISNLSSYFGVLLPKVFGVSSPEIPAISQILLIFYYVIIVKFILNYWPQLKDTFFSFKKPIGPEILIVLFLLVPLIFSFSPFGQQKAVRFILPIYSVFPIIFGWSIWKIARSRRALAGVILIGALVANFNHVLGMFQNSLVKGGEAFSGEKKLISFLLEKNLNYCYTPKQIGQIINFKTKEKIVCATNEREVYPLYALKVDAAPNPAFIFSNWSEAEIFEKSLKAAGGIYHKENISSNFVIYYGWEPPPDNCQQISNKNWRISANCRLEMAPEAIDRNGRTIWLPHQNQMLPGETITVDLGKIYSVAKICLLTSEFKKRKHLGYPLSFKILVSIDGQNWAGLVSLDKYSGTLFWDGPRPFYQMDNGRIELRFWPVAIRYFKMIQTGADKKYGWGINEIYFYQPNDQPAGPGDWNRVDYLIKTLAKIGAQKVWANFWLNPKISLASIGRIETPKTFNEQPFDRRFPFAENIWLLKPDNQTALIFNFENADLNKKFILEQGLKFKKLNLGRWIIFYNFENPQNQQFFWDGQNLLLFK